MMTVPLPVITKFLKICFNCNNNDRPQDGAICASTAKSLKINDVSFFIQMQTFGIKTNQCSTRTIFFFWQRKAWHSRVSLNWFWETYAKTLSWVLSAVQYEILKKKTQEINFSPPNISNFRMTWLSRAVSFLIRRTRIQNKAEHEECMSCRPALLYKTAHQSKLQHTRQFRKRLGFSHFCIRKCSSRMRPVFVLMEVPQLAMTKRSSREA